MAGKRRFSDEELKERRRIYDVRRRSKPGFKEKQKEYNSRRKVTPELKAKKREYCQRSEYRAKQIECVEIVNGKTESRVVADPNFLTAKQIKQVFAIDRIRSVPEQILYVKSAATIVVDEFDDAETSKPFKWTSTAKRKRAVEVGMKKKNVSQQDVVAAGLKHF
jgi:uncharacterized protein YjcR